MYELYLFFKLVLPAAITGSLANIFGRAVLHGMAKQNTEIIRQSFLGFGFSMTISYLFELLDFRDQTIQIIVLTIAFLGREVTLPILKKLSLNILKQDINDKNDDKSE